MPRKALEFPSQLKTIAHMTDEAISEQLSKASDLEAILIIHLHIEAFLNDLLRIRLLDPQLVVGKSNDAVFDFDGRVSIAVATGTLPPDLARRTKAVNKIRNKFAHQIGYELSSADLDSLVEATNNNHAREVRTNQAAGISEKVRQLATEVRRDMRDARDASANEALDVSVLFGRDIQDAARYRRLLDRTEAIDEACFPVKLEELVPDDVAIGWSEKNPAIYMFLIDAGREDEVIGYVNAMPLTRDAYSRVIAGTLLDYNIEAGDIEFYDRPGETSLYLVSIAIAPNSRLLNKGLAQSSLKRLMSALVDQYVWFKSQYNVQIVRVIATGWTAAGERLCEKTLRMTRVGIDKTSRPIFELKLDGSLPADHVLKSLE